MIFGHNIFIMDGTGVNYELKTGINGTVSISAKLAALQLCDSILSLNALKENQARSCSFIVHF